MRHNHKAPIQAPPPPPPPPVVPLEFKAALTVLEAAELMSLGSTSVRVLIKNNLLRGVRVGKAMIIARAEIERFLAAEAGAPVAPPMYARVMMALAQAHTGIAAAKQAAEVLTTAIEGLKAEAATMERAGVTS
jgi:excisionase family DNA binding protein